MEHRLPGDSSVAGSPWEIVPITFWDRNRKSVQLFRVCKVLANLPHYLSAYFPSFPFFFHTESGFLISTFLNYLILILMPIFKLLRSFVTLSLFNTTLQSEFPEIHLILVQKQSFAQMISRSRYHTYLLYFSVGFQNGRSFFDWEEAGEMVNKLVMCGQYWNRFPITKSESKS